jgi:mycothiol S-conjugate amidase
VLNPTLDRPEVRRNIAKLRRLEMASARDILGIRHSWLGFVDSGLPEGDPPPPLPAGCFAAQDVAVAAEPLVRLIRSFRPHVLLTYDEDGGYPHPDHVMTHRISVLAFHAAGDRWRWPEAGRCWQPLKLYYHIASHRRALAYHEEMLAAGINKPFVIALDDMRMPAAKDHRVTTRIACGEFFEVRDRALRAHATQIDPDGDWFGVPLAIQRRVYATEDYQLVRSFVGSRTPEDDLFAGIRRRPHRWQPLAHGPASPVRGEPQTHSRPVRASTR